MNNFLFQVMHIDLLGLITNTVPLLDFLNLNFLLQKELYPDESKQTEDNKSIWLEHEIRYWILAEYRYI